jgi:hypothetical protein
MAFAFAAMARVGDGLIACARFDIPMVIVFAAFREMELEWFEISPFFYHSTVSKSNCFSREFRPKLRFLALLTTA